MPHAIAMVFRAAAMAAAAALLAACSVTADETETSRFPTSSAFPAGTMERFTFAAGVPEQWRLSALRTPDRAQAPWRIVVITGTPSWSEYWAPTIARIGADREMIVVDRPGFAQSEPLTAVTDLETQAQALSPLLWGAPAQRVLVVGQSYGAPIASLMARANPERVQALVLASSYFGERGPTARRLFGVGALVKPLLQRDLRNSITEVQRQGPQLPAAFAALSALTIPKVFLHGDADTFVPLSAAQRWAADFGGRFVDVPGGDHFLNACCVDQTIAAFERAIADAEAPGAADHQR